jgi:hypothetical protein
MLTTNLLKRAPLFIIAVLISATSFAQKKSTKKGSSSTASSVSAGTIGIGVKAGDPTGLSVKFYQPKLAIEIVAGRPYYFSGRYHQDKYYYDRFNDYDKYKGYSYGYGYQLHHYETSNPIAIQVHFLKSKATKTSSSLNWYYGGGPQFRAYKVNYYYRQYYGPKGNQYDIVNDQYTYYDLGLDGVFGLEYTFSDLPLSIFGDVNLFVELADDPLHLELQGGVGIRYNLK